MESNIQIIYRLLNNNNNIHNIKASYCIHWKKYKIIRKNKLRQLICYYHHCLLQYQSHYCQTKGHLPSEYFHQHLLQT